MKKKLILATAVTAMALGAQAGVIALGNTWQTGNNGTAPVLTGESATGFRAATTGGNWMYQLASSGDFTAEAFGIGDTVTMSFTTTLNAAVTVADPTDFRFAMWDETGQGGASAKMDWGPLTALNNAQPGVGDNMSPTAIGSTDATVTSAALKPTTTFEANGAVIDLSYSVTKTAANAFDISFTWDDMTFSGTGLANATADPFDSISGIGIRLNAGGGRTADFTVSDLSVSVIPEPSTFGLVAVIGVGLIGIRRRRI